MRVTVDIQGLKELDMVLKQLGPELARYELQNAARVGAWVIQESIRAEAPRSVKQGKNSLKYGRLTDNIRVTKRRITRQSVEYAVHTGAAFWAYFLEFGTSKMSAKPFAGRGFDMAVDAALQAIAEKLTERLPKVAQQIAGKYTNIPKAVRSRL